MVYEERKDKVKKYIHETFKIEMDKIEKLYPTLLSFLLKRNLFIFKKNKKVDVFENDSPISEYSLKDERYKEFDQILANGAVPKDIADGAMGVLQTSLSMKLKASTHGWSKNVYKITKTKDPDFAYFIFRDDETLKVFGEERLAECVLALNDCGNDLNIFDPDRYAGKNIQKSLRRFEIVHVIIDHKSNITINELDLIYKRLQAIIFDEGILRKTVKIYFGIQDFMKRNSLKVRDENEDDFELDEETKKEVGIIPDEDKTTSTSQGQSQEVLSSLEEHDQNFAAVVQEAILSEVDDGTEKKKKIYRSEKPKPDKAYREGKAWLNCERNNTPKISVVKAFIILIVAATFFGIMFMVVSMNWTAPKQYVENDGIFEPPKPPAGGGTVDPVKAPEPPKPKIALELKKVKGRFYNKTLTLNLEFNRKSEILELLLTPDLKGFPLIQAKIKNDLKAAEKERLAQQRVKFENRNRKNVVITTTEIKKKPKFFKFTYQTKLKMNRKRITFTFDYIPTVLDYNLVIKSKDNEFERIVENTEQKLCIKKIRAFRKDAKNCLRKFDILHSSFLQKLYKRITVQNHYTSKTWLAEMKAYKFKSRNLDEHLKSLYKNIKEVDGRTHIKEYKEKAKDLYVFVKSLKNVSALNAWLVLDRKRINSIMQRIKDNKATSREKKFITIRLTQMDRNSEILDGLYKKIFSKEKLIFKNIEFYRLKMLELQKQQLEKQKKKEKM